MVSKVIGKADTFELIFKEINEGLWTAEVPPNLDGEYILELYAEDDADNVVYLTKMIFIIDKITMKAVLIPQGYSGSICNTSFSAVIKDTFRNAGIMEVQT